MSHNTWAHRIARIVIVQPLAKTAVHPNHVTAARLCLGLVAAACLAVGTPDWRLAGAAVFVVSFLLDRADGDLARLTGRTSPGGHVYDLVADTLCNALTFVGLGFGLTASSLGPWAILMGLVAGAAVAAILLLVMRIESLQGVRAAELKGFAGFDPDDAVLIVPIALAWGAAEALLTAAAIGAPAFALLFLYVFRRKLRAARE